MARSTLSQWCGRLVLPGILLASVCAQAAPPPVLVPGVWTQIGPLEVTTTGYGIANITIDPANPRVLYIGGDALGVLKSADGGSTWAPLGIPANIGHPTSGYVIPDDMEINPADSQHIYATSSGGSPTKGFWVSTNGGQTWTMPQGFVDTNTTLDVTQMSVAPADFNRIILSSHSNWPGRNNAGVLESRDGGVTWTAHPPVPSWPSGTMGVAILHHPHSGTGNANTWLIGTDGDGFWRTTDAGASWTRVSSSNIPHGGHQIYYTETGVLYAGARPYPVRSLDNGATWQSLDHLPYDHYYSVYGDGRTLYTLHSYPVLGGLGLSPFYTSPETDGLTWTPYQGGAQTFNNGPAYVAFDKVNRILYAPMWNVGLWALKVLGDPPVAGIVFVSGFE